MKNTLVPNLIWQVFKPSFSKNLYLLGVNNNKEFMKEAKKKYKDIIAIIPKYTKYDVLKNTILNASVLAAIYLTLDNIVSVEKIKEYYQKSMIENKIAIANIKADKMYTNKYQNKLKSQGENSQKSNNPYTWRFVYYKKENLEQFDAIFDKCGICNLFNKLNIKEIVPAMCEFDYDMAEYTKTIFTRKTTIAKGGQVCDCHYQKKSN